LRQLSMRDLVSESSMKAYMNWLSET
jgi:hypothetical protein